MLCVAVDQAIDYAPPSPELLIATTTSNTLASRRSLHPSWEFTDRWPGIRVWVDRDPRCAGCSSAVRCRRTVCEVAAHWHRSLATRGPSVFRVGHRSDTVSLAPSNTPGTTAAYRMVVVGGIKVWSCRHALFGPRNRGADWWRQRPKQVGTQE